MLWWYRPQRPQQRRAQRRLEADGEEHSRLHGVQATSRILARAARKLAQAVDLLLSATAVNLL